MSSSTNIQSGHTVVQSKENIASDMDGEKVILSVSQGKYYNLGEVGGRIWDIIERPISVKDLTAALVAEYEVAQDICEEQIISFLDDLLKEGLIISDNIIVDE
ncbi:lasso peptide biosynthesis PqqD family chaperone [Phosphitispora fastidiosa]|uniref:lasso peptide biosynthesis PqqD family chaperone n=1 Tax=Phosphitispora fastidiosa TaxID=2837202 RepID=UPI001E5F0315|nr:lasso peptide biosynthesis PqqD family chaperone [Phosphitispora fastidiosa]MBU7007234.1 hypothetical protein [Phosphitispora fastidiosa]